MKLGTQSTTRTNTPESPETGETTESTKAMALLYVLISVYATLGGQPKFLGWSICEGGGGSEWLSLSLSALKREV
jgi:hypothetical protein